MGGVTGPASPGDTALTALLTDYGYTYLIVKDRGSAASGRSGDLVAT
jgi:hypothetical protein